MLDITFVITLMLCVGLIVSLGPPPIGKALPVLMYHQVRPHPSSDLAVSPETFEHQLQQLHQKGYQGISFSDLASHIDEKKPLPRRPVIVTFDDGYTDIETYALPILQAYNMPSTVFLPVGMIGAQNSWDGGTEPLLNYEALFRLMEHRVEYGLHTMRHSNVRNLSDQELSTDIQECINTLNVNQLPHLPVLAYPYGAFHRHDAAKRRAMRRVLDEAGIKFAVRIGSRINRIPILRRFEVTRINVHNTDIDWRFALKLRRGRLRL
mgnify:CR=1 FL=1